MTEFPETQSLLLANIQSLENRQAWDEFVQVYRPVIYRMARRRGMQDSNAQDLAQDVLLRIAKSIDRWEARPGVRFRHWLRKVASNAIVTAMTKSARQAAIDGTVAHEILGEIADESSTQQELDREFQRERYLRAAANVKCDVSEVTWKAFDLTVIQGHSCDHAAEVLGKSIGVVYAARSRILKRLTTEIQRSEERR